MSRLQPTRHPRFKFALAGLALCNIGACASESSESLDQAQRFRAFPYSAAEYAGPAQYEFEDGDREMWVEAVGDIIVTEGDIRLPVNSMVLPDRPRPSRLVSATTTDAFQWDGNVIPYTIDENFQAEDVFLSAIAHWEENTPVRFVRRTDEQNYVKVVDGAGCSSYIGNARIGGQELTLSSKCGFSVAIHEIGHAVGLRHEHTRSDRDQHVDIYWDNIIPGMEEQFSRYVDDFRLGFDVGAYDARSVMHYRSIEFSANDLPTITLKDGSLIEGYRGMLSEGDIQGVNFMLGDDDGIPSRPTDLRIDRYSANSVELFWNRSPGASAYEVERSGALVYEGDGASFYDDDVDPGTTYEYSVIAINEMGRSAKSQVELGPDGGHSVSTEPSTSLLPSPQNLRGQVYSASAIELFWQPGSSQTREYEIYRGDERVATTTGTSFFESGLRAGTHYRYSLVAIDDSGLRSSRVSLEVETNP